MPGQETVFISYRRADSAAQAQQLCDSLAALLRKETVYFDKDMRPGTDFPNEISAAIARAKAVLIIIGPGWLDDMKARESHPNKTDWVLEEVQAALARLQRGDKLLIVPMLLGGAPMPAQDEPKLPAALKELWRVNATHLKEQSRALAASSDDDALLALLLDAGVRRFMGTEDAEALLALGKKVKSLRVQPHMQPISSKWINPPDEPNLATDIPAAIIRLTKAIRTCINPLQPPKKPVKKEMHKTSQEILTLLCNMATDFALAHHWHDSKGRFVVPAAGAGHAINLISAGLNAKAEGLEVPIRLVPGSNAHPIYDNVIDPGVSGIGSDEKAHLHACVWQQLTPWLGGAYPHANTQPLVPDGPEIAKLAGAALTSKGEGKPILIAHDLKSNSPKHSPVRDAAEQLGLSYIGYGPEGLPLNRFSSNLVDPARRGCQNAINEILAT